MKIAYFDAPTGLAGNMILGALLDAGLDQDHLKSELNKLRITRLPAGKAGYALVPSTVEGLRVTKVQRGSISGTFFDVKIAKENQHRNLKDILRIIKQSKLSREVKALSSKIFRRLAEAEAKVHGTTVNQVHFHEVGAIDAIVDIVGFCLGLEIMGIEKVYCSPLPNGRGMIKHAHGRLPNPAPATAELLKGIPTYNADLKGELVTPTGAAIMSTAAEFTDPPRMIVTSLGYGAGTLCLPQPNLLRLFVGTAQLPTEHDAVLQIETNIDDLAPGRYDRAIAKIMKAGALDAAVQPIRMKKMREAVQLQVLCQPEDKDKILDAVFTETTTIGVRIFLVQREKLKREIRQGNKISYLGPRIIRIKPE